MRVMSSTSWIVPGYLVLLAVSLSACAQSPAISPAAVPAMAPANAPAIAPSQSQVLLPASELLSLPPAKRELTSQVLYQFLLAEIAGQRGELKLSAEAYADLAGRTRDARVAKRATEVSLYARQSALALQNARLWQELEPASPKALQTLSSLLVGNGRMAEARPFLQDWVKTGKGGEIFMQLHGLLARQKDKQAVLDLIADLAAAYPTVPEARFAVAQAAWHAGKGAKSLSELDETMRLKPGWSTAPLFKAQVLQQMQGDEAALAFMKEYLATTPGGREVRLAYAKQLARSARFADSRAQFEIMAQEMPDNPENYLAIGLIAMQTNDFDTAEASMTKALELRHPDEGSVRFHLGQLAEARGRPEQALTWYRSVTQGRQQLDAQLRAAVVMGKQGNIAQALEWLASLLPGDDAERIQIAQTEAQLMRDAKNYTGVIETLTKALEKMPDATDLLYDRAMAAEKVDRLDMLEADLRRLIKLKPDFAHAYNALGYTLADRTPRIKEAIELLDKALKLEPDDPFIQDSMGWALFKAKRYAESVELLRRAHASRPDPEIAAHLGEALWLNGDKDEARRIWQGSLQSHPENESLRETTSRLMP
jgi:tetratricopeptide (TPR) repeat protein